MIKEGDIVDVYFENCPCEYGVLVLYTPCATGDSFHLKRKDGVQTFTKIVRR